MKLYSSTLPLASGSFLPHVVIMHVGAEGEPTRVLTRVLRTQRSFSAFVSRKFPRYTRVTILHQTGLLEPMLIHYRANENGILMGDKKTNWNAI